MVRLYLIDKHSSYRMSWDLINSAVNGETTSDEFGRTVTISGDGSVIAVSAPDGNGGKGELTLYTNNGGKI